MNLQLRKGLRARLYRIKLSFLFENICGVKDEWLEIIGVLDLFQIIDLISHLLNSQVIRSVCSIFYYYNGLKHKFYFYNNTSVFRIKR
jgi:hypothetical protein